MEFIRRLFNNEETSSVARRAAFVVVAALLFMLGLQAARLLFYFQYMQEFAGTEFSEVLRAFVVGLRFDVSTVALVFAPFMGAMLLPGAGLLWDRRWPALAFAAVLLLWHLVLLIYIFIDVQYYAFATRHLTFEIQNTWKDLGVFVKIGFMDYMLPTLVLLLFLAFYAWVFLLVYRRTGVGVLPHTGGFNKKRLAIEVAGFVILSLSLLVSVRGGVQMKPLGINDAYFSVNPATGALALNGAYTTLTNLKDTFLEGEGQGLSEALGQATPEDEAAVAGLIVARDREETPEAGYPLLRKYTYAPGEARRMNVVVIVMESWSGKFMGSLGGELSATPYFDALAPEGLLMKRCLANAQRSIEGLPAVLGSLPSFSGMVYGQGGMFSQVRLKPIVRALADSGYSTLFAHGAPADSMRFDGIVKLLGFQEHMSMRDFPDYRAHHDGVWGVNDEHMFVSVEERLSKLKKPFFATLYSLSSHTPYSIPSGTSEEFRFYDDTVPHADFLNSLRYSDYALGRFFERARESDYFRNTLFVITADHAEGRSIETFEGFFSQYHIPCFFYTPGGQVEAGQSSALAGQVDVMPTVLDMLRLPVPFTGWGRSMLAPGKRSLVLPMGDRFIYVEEDYLIYADIERPMLMFEYNVDPTENLFQPGEDSPLNTEAADMHSRLRQYLRFSNSLIRDNRVAPPRVASQGK